MAQSFGRRTVASAGPTGPALPPRAPAPIAQTSPTPQWSTSDPELEQWKQSRKRLPLPWRQIYLMAGLCFGVASLVLPDSINRAVDWLLYALMAASFYAGWRKKRA